MRIGVPKEIKMHEYRVGLTPSSVRELHALGHEIFVQKDAGKAIDFTDDEYIRSGATIVNSVEAVFNSAELIIKVKEPQPKEYGLFRPHHILFTYLHLAPDPEQATGLIKSGCSAIAYETVTDQFGGLPLLAPMSEVAGRMSIQVAASLLQKNFGGRGVLMGGVPGVAPAHVVVIGGGVVGANAARMAAGLGAEVTILDNNQRRLQELDWQFDHRVKTIYSTIDSLEEETQKADVVIGAVLIPGASAPKLVTREMVSKMRAGAIVVDVAIDQGGCCETSRPTNHDDPYYVVDNVIHYCVTNMPGAFARTSAVALNNATLPFTKILANKGLEGALRSNVYLAQGLNVHKGQITHPVVAEALGHPYQPFLTAA